MPGNQFTQILLWGKTMRSRKEVREIFNAGPAVYVPWLFNTSYRLSIPPSPPPLTLRAGNKKKHTYIFVYRLEFVVDQVVGSPPQPLGRPGSLWREGVVVECSLRTVLVRGGGQGLCWCCGGRSQNHRRPKVPKFAVPGQGFRKTSAPWLSHAHDCNHAPAVLSLLMPVAPFSWILLFEYFVLVWLRHFRIFWL